MNRTLRAGLVAGAIIFASGFLRAEPQTRKISRTEDFILFTGSEVPSLIGSETRDLHLFAYGPSGFRAVPFQVDKLDAEGRYVFPDETLYDPKRDGTRLDDNDELVFMVKDAGPRCKKDCRPGDAARGVEIELTDPRDSSKAWVYLFERPGADHPQTEDYVSYRVENDNEYVLSGQYEVGKELVVVGYNWLRLRRPDGEWSRDLLEFQTTWMRARLLNGAIPVYVPGYEVRCRTSGVIDGPVRVIRDEMQFLRIKIIGLEMINEYSIAYYYNGHVTPVNLNLPFTVNKVFLDINIYWALLFTEEIIGSTYSSEANPQGVMLDGNPDTDLDVESDNTYMVVRGPQGFIVETIEWGNLEPYELIRTSLVHDDLSSQGPSNPYPGDIVAGFMFVNTKRIPKGTYNYKFYHYYPYPFSDQKPREVLNMIEQPVTIKAQPLDLQIE